MQRVVQHGGGDALGLDEGGQGKRRIAGAQQGQAEGVPGFRIVGMAAEAQQQQRPRLGRRVAGDQQAGERDQRLRPAGIAFQDLAVGGLGGLGFAGGAVAFSQAQQRFIPVRQAFGQAVHQGAPAGVVLGQGQIEHGDRGGVAERDGGAEGGAGLGGAVSGEQGHAARRENRRGVLGRGQ